MAEPKKQSKALQLYTKYLIQKEAQNSEAENTLNQLEAELNEVHDLDSFIDEIKYRWKGNPWLGGYNKTLDILFSQPSRYETLKDLAEPSTYRNLYDTFKQLIKPTKNPVKKQQGGQLNMNEQQLIELVQAAQGGDQQAQQTIQQIIQAAQNGDQQAMQIAQMIQQILQQTPQAKFGAKLNYIKKLRGQCPEGQEMQYFKSGGMLCKKCVEKKKKCEDGGFVPFAKCGKKVKKKELGGNIGPKKKLDPKTTKTLPGGKYPSYWTSQQRQQWERNNGPGDEGAASTPPLTKKTKWTPVKKNK